MKQISVTKEVQKLEQGDNNQTIYVYIADDIMLKIEWPEGHEFNEGDLTVSSGNGWKNVENKQ